MSTTSPSQVLLCDYTDSERDRLRRQLTRFFQKYDPYKLQSETNLIDNTLLLPITEAAVIEKTCAKYDVDAATSGFSKGSTSSGGASSSRCAAEHDNDGEEDDAHHEQQQRQRGEAASTPVYKYTTAERERLRRRLHSFYQRNAPEKTSTSAAATHHHNRGGGCENEEQDVSIVVDAVFEYDERIDSLMNANMCEDDVMERLCKRYKVDPANEADVALKEDTIKPSAAANRAKRREGIPAKVCDYFGANRNRLRVRLMVFYQNFAADKKAALEKVDDVLRMREAEEAIFRTLRSRYGNVSAAEEQKIAKSVRAFPRSDGDVSSVGGPVCLYTDEDKVRLRQRVTMFYSKYQPDVLVSSTDKADRVLEMHDSEEAIFDRLCEKYNVDPAQEEEESTEAGCFLGMMMTTMVPGNIPASVVPPRTIGGGGLFGGPPVAGYYYGDNPDHVLRLRRRLANFFKLHNPSCTEWTKEQILMKKVNPRMDQGDGDEDGDNFDYDFYDSEDEDEEHVAGVCPRRDHTCSFSYGLSPPLLTSHLSEAALFQSLCAKYKVDPDVERLDARCVRALPVCCLSPSEKDRLRTRVTHFYEEHSTIPKAVAEKKAEAVIDMLDTEESIFDTLCKKYGVDPVEEERIATELGCFPSFVELEKHIIMRSSSSSSSASSLLRHQEEKKEMMAQQVGFVNSYHVCLYPPSERERFRRRVSLFYEKNPDALGEARLLLVSQQQQQQEDRVKLISTKVEKVLAMENSEEEIMRALCAKYSVDEEVEKACARAVGALPLEDEF